MKDSHKRSIVKALTWRAIATLVTVLLVFIFTGNLGLTFGFGSLDIITKLLVYYAYERSWNKISWGKETIKKR